MIRSYKFEPPANEMSKYKTTKKTNYTKRSKKIEGEKQTQIKNFSWRVKLNWEMALPKEKKIKKMRVKLEKIKQKKDFD
jgi:G:T-mismatch repair DNA endonuclease (very short patch repair protein)